jgi:hypothetical protein
MHPLGLYLLISRLQSVGFNTRYINCLSPKDGTRKFGLAKFPCIEIEKPPLYDAIKRHYKLYGISAEEFKYQLEQCPSPPDIICIGSMMTYWLNGVNETIRQVREVYPKTPIAVGGIGVMLFGDYIRNCHYDNVFVVDKEISVAGTLLSPLIFEQSGQDINLLDGLKSVKKSRHGPVLSTLGCPLSCEYCASKLLQPRFIIRPVKQVAQEIKFMAQEHGVKDFAFYDDALLVEPQKTIFPLAQELGSLKNELRFHTPNGLHLRYINKEVLNCFKALNVSTLRFGYESSITRYRRATGQKISPDTLKEKVILLNDAGLLQISAAYVMAGLPDQTVEDVIEEIDTVNSAGMQAKPVFVSPVPGTVMFRYYSERYPQITTDPLWHNDTFFITKLPGWNVEGVNKVKMRCTENNAELIMQN